MSHAEPDVTRAKATSTQPLNASIPYHSMHVLSQFPYFTTPMTCCYDPIVLEPLCVLLVLMLLLLHSTQLPLDLSLSGTHVSSLCYTSHVMSPRL